MATDRPMQLGMIGLGRMGANLVRRLMRDGHRCVVYDVNADGGEGAGRRGATGPARSKTSWPSWRSPAPSGSCCRPPSSTRPSTSSCRCSTPTTPSSTEGTPTTATTSPAPRSWRRRHPLPRLRDERRRLGPRPGLLPDDRRRERGRPAARSDLQDHRAREGQRRADAEPQRRAGRPPTATCTAGPTAPGTSSRWSTTASSTG